MPKYGILKFENLIENGELPEWMDETLGAFIRAGRGG